MSPYFKFGLLKKEKRIEIALASQSLNLHVVKLALYLLSESLYIIIKLKLIWLSALHACPCQIEVIIAIEICAKELCNKGSSWY